MKPLLRRRRHSTSHAAPTPDNTQSEARGKTPSADPANTAPGAKSLFHGLFRRHSDVGKTTTGATPPVSHSHRSSDSQKRTSTSTKPRANVPDTHEIVPSDGHRFSLMEKDLKALFSGAPYFFLERGKHYQWHPQVIFPWDDHDSSIQNMWDRKPLPHSSYTLATLHAHLPIPDGWVVKGDRPVSRSSWRATGGVTKRGTFDIGVYEAPNMLSMNGKEPGSIGFRHFLELPVADSVQYVGPEKPKPRPEIQQSATLSATEAFELAERYTDPYCECDDGTVHDRKKLLCDGPTAWKRIGVRNVHMKTLTGRLETLRRIRHEALYENTEKTILDVESARELYHGLFNKFLHHPPRFMKLGDGDHHDIKSQIKVLAVTLATPGAWFNFSFPEWRFRAGQVLWQAPPHLDGDCLEPDSCDDPNRRPWVDSGLERKWFLLQMLLAGELLLRLDAVVRLGLLHKSDNTTISQQDVQCFDEIRNGKVNWDLVMVRRFFNSFSIGLGSPSDGNPRQLPDNKQDGKHHHFSLFENLAHRVTATTNPDAQSAWEAKLVPFHIQKQMAGLLVFAENIGWPELDTFKSYLYSRIGDGDLAQTISNMYTEPVHHVLPGDRKIKLERDEMYSRSLSRRLVLLSSPKGIGGWITRSWLSGCVAPGKGINDTLMATVLESDPEAINTLGPVANLYGGFSYKGRSWWSKECIVGRVLASMDNTKSCMGWSSNAILPRNASTPEALENTWFDVLVREPPARPKKHRIKQGHKLAARSTPLGVGGMSMEAFSLPVDKPLDAVSNATVNFHALTFNPKEDEQLGGTNIVVSKETSLSFDIGSDSDSTGSSTTRRVSFPLTYNVQFIASQECRPPFGQVSSHGQDQEEHATTPPREEQTRLPGHPLHKYYSYKHTALHSLPETRGPEKSAEEKAPTTGSRRYDVIVVDARGGSNRETFARAWCASVGSHAIIGRVGRTCLACCVREAHAIKAGVVIRVGDDDGECDHQLSIRETQVETKMSTDQSQSVK
ncbi:hypothetical protein PHISP_07244 [Aspergillus sp. HF37]|nr:hypothetical protein PHISP_07244 [Aspergillus sp. HF37]